MNSWIALAVFTAGALSGGFATWMKAHLQPPECPRCGIADARDQALAEIEAITRTAQAQMIQAAQAAATSTTWPYGPPGR